MVTRYHQVISGQLFAHHHTDSIKLFKSDLADQPVSLALLVPGVRNLIIMSNTQH